VASFDQPRANTPLAIGAVADDGWTAKRLALTVISPPHTSWFLQMMALEILAPISLLTPACPRYLFDRITASLSSCLPPFCSIVIYLAIYIVAFCNLPALQPFLSLWHSFGILSFL
jgi:hypothetical protein